MDHKQWRKYEEKCIQEQPPACTATCPVHVDVRSFVSELKAGNFDRALAIFHRNVPFPGIIGRICDAPCEGSCKRSEAGDAVAIGMLERACVQMNQTIPARVSRARKKDKRAAVVGGGLSGMAAATDLAAKGYEVVLFESSHRLGGRLWNTPESILPRDVILEETGRLGALGIETRFNVVLGMDLPLEELRRNFDAVYLGLGDSGNMPRELQLDGQGALSIHPVTYATSSEGVFAGGGLRMGSSYSPIGALSDGKRAALSIDRYFQNASLTAVRNNEGSFKTTLYTSTTDLEPLPMVTPKSADRGYTPQEAMSEASRCIDCQCLECVQQCEYLAHYESYPKKYARQINQNLRIVMGIHGANTFINSCSLCGLCKEVCPTEFDMSELIREARQEMLQNEKMPPSAHDFPLEEMDFANSDGCRLERHQPGWATSSHVFFPGHQLTASAPDLVTQTYAYLREKFNTGVGLMLRSSGVEADWAGNRELMQENVRAIRAEWQKLGEPTLIVAESEDYHVFKTYLPEIETQSLWEVFRHFGIPETAKTKVQSRPLKSNPPLAVHDACMTRYEPEIHESVRSVLSQLGYEVEELPNSKERTECCGYGGLQMYANRELAEQSAIRRAAQSQLDYVAYCAMCRNNLSAVGKRTYHLLDFLFTDGDLKAPTRGPGYSQKRRNRIGLKQRLLTELWGEKVTVEHHPHEDVLLILSPEVARALESRFIPEEDVQKVIEYAQRTGNKVRRKGTNHFLAAYKPVRVTYWVEYTPQDEGYVIHNAYSHRMVVNPPQT
ncbi:pyridine nucleotide-disulfide oxidoreductase/dicluster-binding protein [Alicyclobacillus sp. SO9]|uniref:pyridine nucleotide-disulfide oxidoreductase/dicluster-binding protein n=1 Tax=Alicyclobacillus sp. SO9 TaxID=2665646 RepID=UPI0018E82226|nr:pyridine nucleotide-disulfide oxidoreductase/dicluster-binding protein [Alicyclobacillus sp. SO9]QQE80588.1 NAD(P)-binding protein [Alicyclobacillus sp. SO9]